MSHAGMILVLRLLTECGALNNCPCHHYIYIILRVPCDTLCSLESLHFISSLCLRLLKVMKVVICTPSCPQTVNIMKKNENKWIKI